ncbi:chaperone protein dnaJ 20, chloroplastic-like [Pecten maximus]|uniref:chaperone protein dnaJ 20, chloroplastic-like n=1 Tax=Pecten maximus TaxID=6579 RepID=UPI0014591555|nr:chaperone protein dnaJ 20, chloroplastic-like [Pecten maximus]XP_033760553.1 chaperone protein dnaJ 20, chloroplastic-like [Pecten maximus]
MRCVIFASRLGWMRRPCLCYSRIPLRLTQAAYATKLKRHEFVTVTHYETLGINRDATPKDIKEAFITMSKKYHPDVNSEDPTATATIATINEAYSCLSDENLRRIYDEVTYGSVFQKQDYYVPKRNPGESEESYRARFQNEHSVAWYLHTLRDRTPNVQYARRIFMRDVKILAAVMISLHVLFFVSTLDDDPKLDRMSYRNFYDDYKMGRTDKSASSQYINNYFEDQYKEK